MAPIAGSASRLAANRLAGQSRHMRQLLLLRHAKSSWDQPSIADHERPLNRRGKLAARAMRQAMADLGLQPDLVLVSTSQRTIETLEALEPWAETPLVEPLDALYLAAAPQLLQTLQSTAETVRSVLLIGHNPGLHEFAVLLAGPHGKTLADEHARQLAAGYPSGALAEFTIAVPWCGLGEGAGRLVRFLSPRDLPDPA